MVNILRNIQYSVGLSLLINLCPGAIILQYDVATLSNREGLKIVFCMSHVYLKSFFYGRWLRYYIGCGLGWVPCDGLCMIWNHATLASLYEILQVCTIINFCKPKALVLQIERIAARLHQSSNLKEISSIQFIFEKLSNLGRVSLFTIYIYIYILVYIYTRIYKG